MINIQQALLRATDALATLPDPALEAHYLLASLLTKTRAYLLAFPEIILTADQEQHFNHALLRRQQGEPLAYICGEKEFWSLNLSVGPAVLIPRPETELLVEIILSLYSKESICHVADLGTGSGAIALALASERPRWTIVATDASNAALAIAQQNARQLGIDNVIFQPGDWCAALGDIPFDVIVSNPPYIEAADPDLEAAVLQYEPTEALIAAEEGLADIKKIVRDSGEHLLPGGALFLEHGYRQASAVAKLLLANGFQQITTVKDFQGLVRVSYAIKRD